MGANIKTSDDIIYHYLNKLKATIPTYQRSYEWGTDQISDFLEDLYAEVEIGFDPSSRYFFGPIITTEESGTGNKQIIDGQQRLTTTTIFLAVIRDLMGEIKNISIAENIKHIIKNDLIGDGTEYHEYKLTQIGSIEEYFRVNIQEYHEQDNVEPKKLFNGKGSKGKGKVNNIIRAYNQILTYLRDKLSNYESDEDKVEHLKLIFDVFTKQFFIVEISSPNRTEAFQIFQTINARGLDLSAADLIKSDFFGNSGPYTEEVIGVWETIQGILGDLNYSDFLRYSWNSAYSFTTNRGLYKSVSREMNDSKKINSFMFMLNKLSIAYAELNGDPEVNYLSLTDTGRKVMNILEELNELNFKIYVPIYLAMVNKDYREENMLRIMKKVSTILIKNKILSQGTNWLEKLFSSQGEKINNSSIDENNTVDTILNNLDDYQQDENIIKIALSSYDFSKDLKLARYILRSIENETPGEKGYVPIDNRKVHVEHILPKSPLTFEEWGLTEDLHEEYLWKLGNLTLWLGSQNSGAGNCAFKDKKSIYGESDLKLTRNLSNLNEWNPEQINDRTEDIISQFMAL